MYIHRTANGIRPLAPLTPFAPLTPVPPFAPLTPLPHLASLTPLARAGAWSRRAGAKGVMTVNLVSGANQLLR